jgi:L-alanine-DL-glutamate epimerase-like enolase superfamily enzyme
MPDRALTMAKELDAMGIYWLEELLDRFAYDDFGPRPPATQAHAPALPGLGIEWDREFFRKHELEME